MDIMVRYIKVLGSTMQNNAELCNRAQPDLNDLQKTFDFMGIKIDDLSEYIEQFDCKALITETIPVFPQPSETRLNHMKPGSREVLHRPYHIYDYLPPMYPEMETVEEPILTKGLDTSMKTELNATDDQGAGINQGADNSDLHPLREIASVMMTSSGFISPAREGRTADSRMPAVSRLATQNVNLFDQPGKDLTFPKCLLRSYLLVFNHEQRSLLKLCCL